MMLLLVAGDRSGLLYIPKIMSIAGGYIGPHNYGNHAAMNNPANA